MIPPQQYKYDRPNEFCWKICTYNTAHINLLFVNMYIHYKMEWLALLSKQQYALHKNQIDMAWVHHSVAKYNQQYHIILQFEVGTNKKFRRISQEVTKKVNWHDMTSVSRWYLETVTLLSSFEIKWQSGSGVLTCPPANLCQTIVKFISWNGALSLSDMI